MGIKIFKEGPDFVFGQETDELRALAQVTMLSALTAHYGQEQLFTFTERMQAAIAGGCYALYWERVDGEARLDLPVGFITWGHLSRASAVIFKERMRPLRPDELKSGRALWVIDLAAPLGHMDVIRDCFEQHFDKHEGYEATRLRNGKMRPEKFTNKHLRNKPKA